MGENIIALKRVIIDMDPGYDDAWALQMLLQAENKLCNIKIMAIICCNGNTSLHNSAINAIKVLKAANRLDIPVYKGVENSILNVFHANYEPFHGKDGFGDLNSNNDSYENELKLIRPENGIFMMNEIVKKYPYEITLFNVGPLTNTAMAIRMFPEFRNNLNELYIMGGNYLGKGNTTNSAEFNFYSDPEAAYIVFDNPSFKITILPWEACIFPNLDVTWTWRKASFKHLIEKNPVLALLTPIETAIIEDRSPIWAPCDAICVACFLFPNKLITKVVKHNVTVELNGTNTRGQMIIDHLNIHQPNCFVIEQVSTEALKEILLWTMGEEDNTFSNN